MNHHAIQIYIAQATLVISVVLWLILVYKSEQNKLMYGYDRKEFVVDAITKDGRLVSGKDTISDKSFRNADFRKLKQGDKVILYFKK